MLSGAVVRLRPVREDDLDWLVTECSKPSGFGEFEPFYIGKGEAFRREFDDHGLLAEHFTLLVIEDRAGRRIGVASIDGLDRHSRVARINATILDPHERGKGLGTDAHRVLLDYLFRHLGLARVEAFVVAENLAARALLKRLGFHEEGTLRSRVYASGQRHDVVAVGLLADEWTKRVGPEILTI